WTHVGAGFPRDILPTPEPKKSRGKPAPTKTYPNSLQKSASFLIEVLYSRRDIIFPTTAMTRNRVKPLTIGDRAFNSRLLADTGKS
ncbi:MAG: hypothetical protein OSB19_17605, partial [Opitutaceae bacterium]|nr:hypothetical protein [Opitutaceae bacterium]